MRYDDDVLDAALRTLDPARGVADPAVGELDRLVSRARRQAPPRRLTRRTRLLLGSALALTLVGGTAVAGTTYQHYLLTHAPFVGLDDGQVRSNESIRYVPPYGADRGEHCDLYPEFSGVTAVQLAAVDARIRSSDWSRLPAEALADARAAGSITPSTSDDAAEVALDDALKGRLVAAFAPDIPSLRVGAPGVDGATLDGWTSTCRGTW